ncbi:hypothetical protein E2C01_007086 [Portunus trituberculatus]|uniref:Uncharacterized protein n=1 Tax=Portunus trituberculatus TaxID=210409 RepID=A0A5B7CX70_PORTR|nr:hypothetical protein [Portunus trituberculatus]
MLRCAREKKGEAARGKGIGKQHQEEKEKQMERLETRLWHPRDDGDRRIPDSYLGKPSWRRRRGRIKRRMPPMRAGWRNSSKRIEKDNEEANQELVNIMDCLRS